MNDIHIITAASDIAEHHFEIEVTEWRSVDLVKTCLSCGALQQADGSIPCGH